MQKCRRAEKGMSINPPLLLIANSTSLYSLDTAGKKEERVYVATQTLKVGSITNIFSASQFSQ